MNARKLGVSLPANQFRALERMRKRLGLKRSQAVQEALARWLEARNGDDEVERYLRGYARIPEDAREGKAMVRAWAMGLPAEDWS